MRTSVGEVLDATGGDTASVDQRGVAFDADDFQVVSRVVDVLADDVAGLVVRDTGVKNEDDTSVIYLLLMLHLGVPLHILPRSEMLGTAVDGIDVRDSLCIRQGVHTLHQVAPRLHRTLAVTVECRLDVGVVGNCLTVNGVVGRHSRSVGHVGQFLRGAVRTSVDDETLWVARVGLVVDRHDAGDHPRGHGDDEYATCHPGGDHSSAEAEDERRMRQITQVAQNRSWSQPGMLSLIPTSPSTRYAARMRVKNMNWLCSCA